MLGNRLYFKILDTWLINYAYYPCSIVNNELDNYLIHK